MMNLGRSGFQPCLNQALSRSLVAGALATVSLVCGLAPDLSSHSKTLLFSSTAYAQQQFSAADVATYAKAVLDLEAIRQQFYNDVKQIIGSSNIPEITCENYPNLSDNVRKVAENFCKKSEGIIINYFAGGDASQRDVAIKRFNTMTRSLQSDAGLKTRVHDELIREQQRRAGK